MQKGSAQSTSWFRFRRIVCFSAIRLT
jgi:hypothetical protein